MDRETFGPYLLLSPLDGGGPGRIWHARDTRRNRDVALRVLPAELNQDLDDVRRFRRQLSIAARLTAPNVVPVHDYGEIDGQLYIDMPLIAGDSLSAVLRQVGPLTPRRATRIVAQIAAGLDAMHVVGLVHRDVTPSNILITTSAGDEVALLTGFGLDLAGEATHLTSTGVVAGSLAYMAPERFLGAGDDRADVYAIGCVLYECLTGRQAFPGSGAAGQLYAHLNNPPPRPSRDRPDVPAALDDVIARGLAKQPGERYPSAGALAAAALAALEPPGPEPTAGWAPMAPVDRPGAGSTGAHPAWIPPPSTTFEPAPAPYRRRLQLPTWPWRRGQRPSTDQPPPSPPVQVPPVRTGPSPDEPAPRRIEVAVASPTAPNGPPRPVIGPLALGATYLLQFGIGAGLPGNVVPAGAPIFPTALLTPDSPQGYWLTVNVRGDGLQIPPGPHPVFLPLQGPSWVCGCAPGQPHRCGPDTRWPVLQLPFLTPRQPGRYTLLVSVYSGATLVQAVRVELPVATSSSDRPSATVTFTLGGDPAVVAARPSRSLSILSEPAPDGRHRLHVKGEWPGPPIMFEFSDAAAAEAARHLRTLLFDTHLQAAGGSWTSRYRPDLSTDLPTYTADLHRLAIAGSEAFLGAFGGQGPALRDRLAWVGRTTGRPAEIQLARAVNTRLTVPWQMVYDEPIDDTRAPSICPSVAEFGPGTAGSPGWIPAGCPHTDAHEPGRGTLCPFGFWGLAHHIECPPASFTRPLADTTGMQFPATLTVALHPDLAGTTWPEHGRALRMLDTASLVHSSLETLRQAVIAGTDVLYFYCHGLRVTRPGSSAPRPVLDLGPGGRLSPLTLSTWTTGDPAVRWDTRRPLVVLNGCHTGEMLPDTPVELVTAFVDGVGAAGVIATEITLDAAFAAPAAELFLGPLFAGATVAAAIRTMRWTLLGRGNVLGLAYSPYCDARLHLPTASREENRR